MKASARPPSPAASTVRPRVSGYAIGLTLAIGLYGIGYLLWFLQTPLGRAPQLDAAENLALARQIADGTLAHEPFYRAMLYPAVLAIPLKLGLHTYALPAFAALLGLLSHFFITLGLARLARQVWDGPRAEVAGLIAAGLWGLNPVALFYALDALDAVPSLALAVWALVGWSHPRAGKFSAAGGGLLLGLAVAARPHFLPWVFIAPLLCGWLACRWRLLWSDALAWAGALAVLLAVGGVQKYWGGEFAILPTQGSYNFYAANKAGANGRYYAQQGLFTDIAPGENPARKESELLYAKATAQQGPIAIADMNAYWNQQARAHIQSAPGEWLGLLGRKTYYLFNDFDQYNNKTYAWHKAESPFLWWNLLGWGILLVLSAGILALRGRGKGTLAAEFNCPMIAAVSVAFFTYAAGVLLYYASGRFRLPLMALLCLLAGGWAAWPGWAKVARGKILALALAVPVAAFITFSNFFEAHDEATFIQDELLSANAAAQVGDDAEAGRLAEQALLRDPARPDARRIAVLSYFNQAVMDGEVRGSDTISGWRHQLEHLANVKTMDDSLALAAGSAYWKTGDRRQAELLWTVTAGQFGPRSASARALLAAQTIRGEAPTGSPAPDGALIVFLKKPASSP